MIYVVEEDSIDWITDILITRHQLASASVKKLLHEEDVETSKRG